MDAGDYSTLLSKWEKMSDFLKAKWSEKWNGGNVKLDRPEEKKMKESKIELKEKKINE